MSKRRFKSSVIGGDSNYLDVIDNLRASLAGLEADTGLAREMAEIVGGGIHDRCMRQEGPDGSIWFANAESTIKEKGHDIVGLGITQEMLTRTHFTSSSSANRDGIVIHYDGPAEKIRWFEGDNRYGISRPLWGLDPTIRAEISDRLRDHFKDNLH